MGTWDALPVAHKEHLLHLYTTGCSIEEKAREFGLNAQPASVERYIRHYRQYKRQFTGQMAEAFQVPPTLPAYNEYTVLEADDAIVISDLEIPDHDARMLKYALMVGVKRNIRTLVYNGDVVATDQDTLNTWAREFKHDNETTYRTTMDKTRQVFGEFGKWFTDQYFVTGNHDARVAKATGGEIHLDMLMYGSPVNFSRYAYMYMKTVRGWVYICHPRNYSIHAGSKLGNDLWATHIAPDSSKCHIVLGHTHLAQTAWSADGQQELVSTGCMRHRAEYKDTSANTYRAWQRGFLVIQNGYFYPYTEFGTDWERELA